MEAQKQATDRPTDSPRRASLGCVTLESEKCGGFRDGSGRYCVSVCLRQKGGRYRVYPFSSETGGRPWGGKRVALAIVESRHLFGGDVILHSSPSCLHGCAWFGSDVLCGETATRNQPVGNIVVMDEWIPAGCVYSKLRPPSTAPLPACKYVRNGYS